MADATVRIDVDTSEVDHELNRIGGGFDIYDVLRLEHVLTSQFAETQRIVHVRTRSLKTSGRVNSNTHEHSFAGRTAVTGWQGEIHYGGPSPGSVHDPVDYALYEMARGDVHNFLHPAYDETSNARYIAALMAFVRGGVL